MGVEELHIGYSQQDIQAATEIEVCVLRSDHFYEMSQLMPIYRFYCQDPVTFGAGKTAIYFSIDQK